MKWMNLVKIRKLTILENNKITLALFLPSSASASSGHVKSFWLEYSLGASTSGHSTGFYWSLSSSIFRSLFSLDLDSFDAPAWRFGSIVSPFFRKFCFQIAFLQGDHIAAHINDERK